MEFAGLNSSGIVAAAVAGFAFGALWYGIFGKPWMAAAGLSEADVKGAGKTPLQKSLPFLFAAFANILMAFILAGLMGHFAVDVRHGLITAGFVWAGFVMPTVLVNYGFQMRPFRLTLIDAGHWLGVLMVMGLVLGLMGAPG